MAITPVSLFSDEYTSLNSIHSTYGVTAANEADKATRKSDPTSFDAIFSAAVDMYKEADSLQKAAESAEMSFALGYTDSIHDVANAQRKASIALQYTVRVTNAVVSAYKELMNMQL
ncbi:MAG: flagellar hook-basal body complex protein FliE [Eubacteriales bacterium]|nr:flagellar hook-basal body complex protein FliE [Lachnospiraceae bacterium]MDO5127827.1 flagellar hook-basal body complex protein FliE [Eubacteriales bacterium]